MRSGACGDPRTRRCAALGWHPFELSAPQGIATDEEVLQTSVRKFLRTVGVSSQRAIEEAIAKALQDGTIDNVEVLPVEMTLVVALVNVRVTFGGELKLP